ncbi:hypothetical protein AAFC00_003767 [Neodothiora populina]|uniref:AB hydrolase-1 domain-containing protein n=1 Tax=Neodothiora populina TaxID=2781224 RepID=A0ABR3PFB6_9PEZI
MAQTPGILYVTMQPSSSLPAAEFHDWYNNEHGPNRLRLPFIKNGFRYRAIDLNGSSGSDAQPEWMAIYDTPSMDEFNSEAYLALRGSPVQSQRERDIRPSVKIDRRSYDLISTRSSPAFKPLENIENASEGNIVLSALLTPHPDKDAGQISKWYEEEHTDMITKVPGWLRTRRFVTAKIDGKDTVDYLALHEFSPSQWKGLDIPEFKAATTTPWAKDIMTNVIKDRTMRIYELFYNFGAAPRDIGSFISAGRKPWDNPPTKTRTIPSGSNGGAVESYITTKDGVDIPYRIESNTTDPNAPLIVLCNSILVEWGIWDKFVDSFLSKSKSGFRVLRYHTRGRYNNLSKTPVTVDLLASDIIALLDELKVPKAALAMGVSLGGATVLNAALNYPDRIGAFASCDTNDKSPAGNSKAWTDRIAIAEKENASAADDSNTKIVGDELAEVTVRRWFVKESYDGAEMEKECERVKDMVVRNSLEGFKGSVRALWEYDMQPLMKGAKVKGLFVAGSGDGVLPKTMKDMAERYGSSGTECVIIEGAGHLPMVEKPEDVAAVAIKALAL